MKKEHIENFLIDYIETKKTFLIDLDRQADITNKDRVDEFLLDVKPILNELSEKAKLAYITIALSHTTSKFDYCSLLEDVDGLKSVFSIFKIYDIETAGFSNEMRRQYRVSLDKYLNLMKHVFDEETFLKMVDKNIKELSPNIILLLMTKPEILKAITRKKISISNYSKLFRNDRTKEQLFKIASRNINNQMFQKIVQYHQENKEKIKKDKKVYYSALSFYSLLLPEIYPSKIVMKELMDDLFLNKHQVKENIKEWCYICIEYFDLKHFEEDWKKMSKEYYISGFEKEFEDSIRMVSTSGLEHFAPDEMKSSLLQIERYCHYRYMKDMGIPPHSPQSFNNYSISKEELKEYGLTKKQFIADILGVFDEFTDYTTWLLALKKASGSWGVNISAVSRLIPLKEWIFLKNEYPKLFNEDIRKIGEFIDKNGKTVSKHDFVGYKLVNEILEVIALYLELSDDDLEINEDSKEILKMNFKI